MFKKYSKTKLILFTLLFFFFFGTFLLFSKSDLALKFKGVFPTSFKDNLRDTVFIIPSKIRDIQTLKSKLQGFDLKIRKLENEIDVLSSKINNGKTMYVNLQSKNNTNFLLKKIFLDYSLDSKPNKMEKKNGYLEFYNNKILAIFWTGKIIYTNKENLINNNVSFFEINTNINDFLKHDEKDKFISIKDSMISGNNLYLSYTKNLKPDSNCLNLSIIKAEILKSDEKFELGSFEEFFTYDECLEARFNGYQSGGRMVSYKNNNILLTIGDFQNFSPAQDLNSFFGKIISINKNSKEYKLVSMGHRNQQGLYYDNTLDIIISTEHGQKGGDEVNLIIDDDTEISNYGWPIASYSDYYGYETKEIKQKAPFKKSHKDNGFIEPIIYFTPALGISQIIKNTSFKKNDNYSYLVTSMKKKKIILLQLNQNLNSATVKNEIYLDERIRDIIKFEKNNYLLFLENSPAIGILSEN